MECEVWKCSASMLFIWDGNSRVPARLFADDAGEVGVSHALLFGADAKIGSKGL